MPSNLLPEFTAPQELRHDLEVTKSAARRVGQGVVTIWRENKHVLLTAIIAGIVSRYTGRPVAKFENTVIGGIAAGFSALRDPRDKLWKQLLVAVGYGASWGLTDVYVPKILDLFSAAGNRPVVEALPAPEQRTIAGAPAVANEALASPGRWGLPRRGPGRNWAR